MAQHYWLDLVKPGDTVIDATCGNGHDTLKLCQLALAEGKGKVYAFDIQQEAIESTRSLLRAQLPKEVQERIELHFQSHESFPESLTAESVSLIVYNLGYLPGGNKNLTTNHLSTRQSLEQALPLIKSSGAISLTCYPGHPEGAQEQKILLEFAANLSPLEWSCCHNVWLNRKAAPTLLFIQRRNRQQCDSKEAGGLHH